MYYFTFPKTCNILDLFYIEQYIIEQYYNFLIFNRLYFSNVFQFNLYFTELKKKKKLAYVIFPYYKVILKLFRSIFIRSM